MFRPLAFSGGLLLFLASLPADAQVVASLPAPAAQQILKGHVPPITKRLAPINRLDGGTHLDMAIGLPLRNREALTNLLQELYQPGNAGFRHYLTPDQFAASFGPSQADYQKVIDFATVPRADGQENPPQPHVAGCLRVGRRH